MQGLDREKSLSDNLREAGGTSVETQFDQFLKDGKAKGEAVAVRLPLSRFPTGPSLQPAIGNSSMSHEREPCHALRLRLLPKLRSQVQRQGVVICTVKRCELCGTKFIVPAPAPSPPSASGCGTCLLVKLAPVGAGVVTLRKPRRHDGRSPDGAAVGRRPGVDRGQAEGEAAVSDPDALEQFGQSIHRSRATPLGLSPSLLASINAAYLSPLARFGLPFVALML